MRAPPEMYAYKDHKKKIDKGNKLDALGNRVEFRISFEDWWEKWKDYFHLRGRGSGKYVMSRRNDIGHYEKDNVFVQLSTDNIKQALIGAKRPNVGKKISEYWVRKKASGWEMPEEQRMSISKGTKGKPKPAQSEAMKQYWAKRREETHTKST
jgi:hypothetical protein